MGLGCWSFEPLPVGQLCPIHRGNAQNLVPLARLLRPHTPNYILCHFPHWSTCIAYNSNRSCSGHSLYFKGLFLLPCVWVCTCLKRASNCLELELQVTVSCLAWARGNKLWSFEEQQVLLTSKPPLQPLITILLMSKLSFRVGNWYIPVIPALEGQRQ